MRIKRPYARVTELLPHRALFIATSNLTDILADPGGSGRRFEGFRAQFFRPLVGQYGGTGAKTY